MQEEKKNLLWLFSRIAESNADDIIRVHFISVEALQRIAYCVLRKPSKRNTKHAIRLSLNSFETHPYKIAIRRR